MSPLKRLAFVGIVSLASLQTASATTCSVAILDPAPGSLVGQRAIVKGTATLPPGSHLWLFARREGLSVWWPQGGGPAEVNDREFSVLSYFGIEADKGPAFEVRAAIVDGRTSQAIAARLADATSDKSMVFPDTIDGCPVAKLRVQKDSR